MSDNAVQKSGGNATAAVLVVVLIFAALVAVGTWAVYTYGQGHVVIDGRELQDLLAGNASSFWTIMIIYVVLMLFLGTLLDTASIILIVVPLFLPLVEALDLSLIWFGIITVVGAEIGLLTPPLGISCFVIKSTINDDRISLKDVFMGALPFAFVMLIVLVILIAFPILSLALI